MHGWFQKMRFFRKHCHKGPCCLKELYDGEKATVLRVDGESAERSKLCSMGITPGVELEVGCNASGKYRLRVRDCSMALDDSLAGLVVCNPTGCARNRHGRHGGHGHADEPETGHCGACMPKKESA